MLFLFIFWPEWKLAAISSQDHVFGHLSVRFKGSRCLHSVVTHTLYTRYKADEGLIV